MWTTILWLYLAAGLLSFAAVAVHGYENRGSLWTKLYAGLLLMCLIVILWPLALQDVHRSSK